MKRRRFTSNYLCMLTTHQSETGKQNLFSPGAGVLCLLVFNCLFFVAPKISQAAEHYIRQGASGSNNGADWINAWTSLPPALVRGDTYYVAAGEYGGYTFDDAVSGTQFITIKKAFASNHGTDAGWQDSYGDGQAVFGPLAVGASYIKIDGQTGGGPASWDTGHGFVVRNPNKGISITTSVSNVEVRHVAIIYEMNAGYSYPTCNESLPGGQDAIYGTGSVTNAVFSHMYIYRPGRTAWLTRGTWNNVTIEYSSVKDATCCQYLGPTGCQHGEIWSADHTAGILSGAVIRYNYFDRFQSTGGLVMAGGNGVYIYGNIFRGVAGQANGAITNWDSSATITSNVYVFNNSFVDTDAQIGWNYCSGWFVYNNLFYSNNRTNFTNVVHDYSVADVSLSEAHPQTGFAASAFTDYAGGNFSLAQSTMPAKDLKSEAWWNPAYCSDLDMLGTSRGADGVWDRGAYEYVSVTPGDLTAPATPNGLAVQ